MKRSLPESALARMALSVATSAFSRVTGSAAHFSLYLAYSTTLSAHFTEQPNTRVEVTGGSLPASSASSASRVSCLVARDSRSESSMRPSKRSLRDLSKMNTCGVATGPILWPSSCFGPSSSHTKLNFSCLARSFSSSKESDEIRIRQLVEPHRVRVIRIDGDELHALGRVVGDQLLDALLVGLRRRAMRAGEHEHQDVRVLEGLCPCRSCRRCPAAKRAAAARR